MIGLRDPFHAACEVLPKDFGRLSYSGWDLMLFQKKSVRCVVLLFVWVLIYLGNISTPAFFDDADSVHAEAVREMVESGDWVTLKINNGIRYLEKAPLMYWLSALTVKMFGLSQWAIRLPVALFALFLTLLVFSFGNRFLGEKAGFYSALVFVACLGPYAFTRMYLPDVILSFFLALCFYLYLQILYEPDSGRRIGPLDVRCILFYVSAALAVLTKGLVGIVFAGAVICAHILLTGQWKVIRRLQILPGILVFLAVAAPWHLAAGFSNKGFFWFYFVNEHFLRYLGLRHPKDYDTVPRLLFWALHLVWVFPWTGFAWGISRIFPRSLKPESKADQTNLFLVCWILVILVFFSFSTTQEYYTFPTLAAFALLLGQVVARMDSPEGALDQRRAAIGSGVIAGIGCLAGAGLFALAWLGSHSVDAADLSGTLTFNPDQYALAYGHLHDLTPETFAYLSDLVYKTALLFFLGPLLAFAAGLWRRWNLSAMILALTMVGLAHSYNAGMVAFEPVLSSKGLAKVIEYHYKPGDRVVINGIYEKGSTINFYTGIQVSLLNGHHGNLWYGSFFPDAPDIFLDDASFVRMWNSRPRIFLFSEEAPLKRFLSENPGFRYTELAAEGGKKVLINW